MHVTLITSTPQTVELGSGTYVASHALQRGLSALGHDVHVLSPHHAPRGFGLTARRFLFNAGLRGGASPGTDLMVGLDMDGFLLAGRYHPFVAFPHGVLADEAGFERGVVRRLLLLQARAECYSVNRADLVLATSAYSRDRITELYGLPRGRVEVVPPAFDVDQWKRELNDLPHPGTPRGGPTVFCVARMYPRKNIAALVRATSVVRERFPSLQVRIGGDGPERHRLARLVLELGLSPHVHLLGQLSRADLQRELVSCDVFCLPSLQEGFGLVFLEAMAAGKPVVACRASSTPELIEHGVNGYLATPGDERDLAEQLSRCLAEPATRAAMAEANRSAAQRFRSVTTARLLVDLLTERLFS